MPMQPFIEAKREQIAELCRMHHVRRLSLFGSAVRDDFDPNRSDVDVRVEFDESADLGIDNYLGSAINLPRSLAAKWTS